MRGGAMTTRDADFAAQTRAKRLRFERYVLDLDRGCLLLDGTEIALRPKTFAVLHYLIENSGRLVSKDELFAAVWPNVAITDDALVQSIGELRRALGADGPRLIKTIPRRGYRFESVVSVMAPIDASAAGRTLDPPAPAIKRRRLPSRHLRRHSPQRRLPDGARPVAAIAVVIVLAAGALLAGLTIRLEISRRPATRRSIHENGRHRREACDRRRALRRTRVTIRVASTSPTA